MKWQTRTTGRKPAWNNKIRDGWGILCFPKTSPFQDHPLVHFCKLVQIPVNCILRCLDSCDNSKEHFHIISSKKKNTIKLYNKSRSPHVKFAACCILPVVLGNALHLDHFQPFHLFVWGLITIVSSKSR